MTKRCFKAAKGSYIDRAHQGYRDSMEAVAKVYDEYKEEVGVCYSEPLFFQTRILLKPDERDGKRVLIQLSPFPVQRNGKIYYYAKTESNITRKWNLFVIRHKLKIVPLPVYAVYFEGLVDAPEEEAFSADDATYLSMITDETFELPKLTEEITEETFNEAKERCGDDVPELW